MEKRNSYIKYYKLFDLLARRGMKRTDLKKEPFSFSPATIAKLGQGETVTTETISRLCQYLNCQPGDIMEYEPPAKEEK